MLRCDRAIVERSGRMVIDRLSLTAAAGETLAVIGRSGAGKSSLLAAAAGALPVRGGDILVAGHSLRRAADAARMRLGYVPSHLPAWPAVRADEFLALFGRAAGLAGRPLREAVTRALALADLEGGGATAIDTLPDGQAKMLLLGRALLHDPDLLLVDDPCGGLDPHQRRTVERLIGDLQIAGRTVVAAIDDARVPDCFTHLVVLAEGRAVRQGPAVFAAFASGRDWRCRLSCPGQAAAAATIAGRLGARAEVVDADTLDCTVPGGPAVPPASPHTLAILVEAVVGAGIAVTAAGPHPHWTIQLLDTPA